MSRTKYNLSNDGRDIFYATDSIIQLGKNYVNLKCCSGQKLNVIVIKTAHRRCDFLETLISQEIFFKLP